MVDEKIFEPEYNRYDKIIASKYTSLVASLLFAITGLLNIFNQPEAHYIIIGIMFLIMAILSFSAAIQGRPYFTVRKDYQNIKISSEKIIINQNSNSWTAGKKIYFSRIKKITLQPKNVTVDYNIGTHGKVRLGSYKPHQISEIQKCLKEVAESNDILVEGNNK